jgi:hypothetical protein
MASSNAKLTRVGARALYGELCAAEHSPGSLAHLRHRLLSSQFYDFKYYQQSETYCPDDGTDFIMGWRIFQNLWFAF